jgi:hypothetical protein
MKSWKTKSGYTIILLLAGRSNVFLITDGQRNGLIYSTFDLKGFGFNAYIWHKPGHWWKRIIIKGLIFCLKGSVIVSWHLNGNTTISLNSALS